MKFIQMLFIPEMVQALKANRKNRTRRTKGLKFINKKPDSWSFKYLEVDKKTYAFFENVKKTVPLFEVACPYGKVGDVIWVRETFCATGSDEYLHADTNLPFFYKADLEEPKSVIEVMREFNWKWKPNLHMPKLACRFFLEVTSISLERLQDISEADAQGEGIKVDDEGFECWDYLLNKFEDIVPEQSFKTLWVKINGNQSWKANPWVWVIQFKQVQKPENFITGEI